MPIPDGAAPPPFPGFSPAALAFLAALRDHNDREWFKERKAVYDAELRDPLRLLVADTGRSLAAAGSAFRVGKAMRIYRDVRFSSDKSPYRTSLSASFSRSEEGDPVFLYVHVEPGASFVASGLYRAAAKTLRPVRERAAANPGSFRALSAAVAESGLEFGSMGHELSSMPRGFAAHKDGPVADVLRWESWVAQRALSDEEVSRPSLVEVIVSAERAARPLVAFIDEAGAPSSG